MDFNIYEFGEVCISLLPIVIVLSVFISAFLRALMQHYSYGTQIAVTFSYVFSIGVIVHEVAHQMMCKIFGVKVKEACYFKVERWRTEKREYANIGGYVNLKEVSSVISSLFLGIAPVLVNGLIVALFYYYYPVWRETSFNGLLIYLGIALALGARPSKEDLTLWMRAFQKNPGRGTFEIFLLCGFGFILFYLLFYEIGLQIIFVVVIVFLILCVIQGRAKLNGPKKRYLYR